MATPAANALPSGAMPSEAPPSPWSGFGALAALQQQARRAAARSVDEILTVRSWLIGAWISFPRAEDHRPVGLEPA